MKETKKVIGLKVGERTILDWPYRIHQYFYSGEGCGIWEVRDGWTGKEVIIEERKVIPKVVFNVEPLSREDYLKRTVSKNGYLGISLKDLFVADQKNGQRSGPCIKIKPHHIP